MDQYPPKSMSTNSDVTHVLCVFTEAPFSVALSPPGSVLRIDLCEMTGCWRVYYSNAALYSNG